MAPAELFAQVQYITWNGNVHYKYLKKVGKHFHCSIKKKSLQSARIYIIVLWNYLPIQAKQWLLGSTSCCCEMSKQSLIFNYIFGDTIKSLHRVKCFRSPGHWLHRLATKVAYLLQFFKVTKNLVVCTVLLVSLSL